jgi:DNA repair protein RecO (recombination protein O)
MEWHDEGIIVSQRKYGEYDAILEVFTRSHGRHAGIVKGGTGRNHRGNIQVGNEINVTWRGRLETHLGTFSIEIIKPRAVDFLYTPSKLSALSSSCAILCVSMAEHEKHEVLLDGLLAFLDGLYVSDDNILNWGPLLVQFELGLLSELGFGLNLSNCAATGTKENLVYVSPKSGRAVSSDAGRPYHDKMLTLPNFLINKGYAVTQQDILDGLILTEYFMDRHMLQPFGKKLPPARRMIMDYIV